MYAQIPVSANTNPLGANKTPQGSASRIRLSHPHHDCQGNQHHRWRDQNRKEGTFKGRCMSEIEQQKQIPRSFKTGFLKVLRNGSCKICSGYRWCLQTQLGMVILWWPPTPTGFWFRLVASYRVTLQYNYNIMLLWPPNVQIIFQKLMDFR